MSYCVPEFNIVVAGTSRIGERKAAREDCISVELKEELGFFAVFDGHGGYEAANYARQSLWNNIKESEGFGIGKQGVTAEAVKSGFIKTHEEMREISGKPPYLCSLASQTAFPRFILWAQEKSGLARETNICDQVSKNRPCTHKN